MPDDFVTVNWHEPVPPPSGIQADKTMIERSPTPIDFLPSGPVELPYIYADGLAFAEPRDPAWLDAWLESLASAIEVEFIGTPGLGPAAA